MLPPWLQFRLMSEVRVTNELHSVVRAGSLWLSQALVKP